jgi:hypothetical protein
MCPSSWPGADNLFPSAAFDAMQALEATRAFRELESSLLSRNAYTILDQQSTIELSTRELGAYDPVVLLAKVGLPDMSMRIERLMALGCATELHSRLLEVTKLGEHLSAWTGMQQRIKSLVTTDSIVCWDEITRSAAAWGLADPVARQLARIGDLDMILKAATPDSTYAAWASHLRITALPALSFLAQEWSTPVGLLTPAGRETGASVSWLARYRGEPRLMTSALTPRAESHHELELLLDEEILCVLCGGPMVTIGRSISWIGPHRGVRQRRIFPACAECMKRDGEEPGFLYNALCELARPSLGIRGVIRGGGRGDGRPRGRLRLIRMNDGDHRA